MPSKNTRGEKILSECQILLLCPRVDFWEREFASVVKLNFENSEKPIFDCLISLNLCVLHLHINRGKIDVSTPYLEQSAVSGILRFKMLSLFLSGMRFYGCFRRYPQFFSVAI